VGLTLLTGRSHTGKSWFTLQLALAVASGSQVVDLQGKVLYLALEDPPWRLHRRLQQLAPAEHLPLQFACAWPKFDPSGATQGLWRLAAELHRGPRLVIVDTLTTALSPACQDSAAGVHGVLACLHTLAVSYDAAIVLVDRHRNDAGQGAPDAIDAALAAAGDAGIFTQTMLLDRPFGARGATLRLGDCPHPLFLTRHPDLKHPTPGTAA
jgi:RecA-family ATPase